MTSQKEQAQSILTRLYRENKNISVDDYVTIWTALDRIETIEERDRILEELWQDFEDIPIDPKTECIEERFMNWEKGTDRETIWHWFDQWYSKGITHLLYGDGFERTDIIAKLIYLKEFCHKCLSSDCPFNYDGECRYVLVYERTPNCTT